MGFFSGRSSFVWFASALLCGVTVSCSSPDEQVREHAYGEIVPGAADARSASAFLGWEPGPAGGPPVTLAWFNDDTRYPEKTASLRAATKLVNDELGGVSGRRLEINECTAPTEFVACASETLSGAVLAMVGYGASSEVLDVLSGVPLVMVEPSGPENYRRPYTVTFSLTRAGVVRAAASWLTGRYDAPEGGEVLVLVPAGGGREAQTFASGLARTRKVKVIEVDDGRGSDAVTEQVSGLLEQESPDVIVTVLGPAGCVGLAAALDDRTGDQPLVVTSGQCAARSVYEELGDWTKGWVHVAGGVDLVNYDEDEEAALYRDRFRRFAGPGADSTASTALVFSAVLDTTRILGRTVGTERADVLAALTGYEGPLFAAAGPARCGTDPEHPVLCLHSARLFRYEGRHCEPVVVRAPSREDTLVESCVNEWTNVTGTGVLDIREPR